MEGVEIKQIGLIHEDEAYNATKDEYVMMPSTYDMLSRISLNIEDTNKVVNEQIRGDEEDTLFNESFNEVVPILYSNRVSKISKNVLDLLDSLVEINDEGKVRGPKYNVPWGELELGLKLAFNGQGMAVVVEMEDLGDGMEVGCHMVNVGDAVLSVDGMEVSGKSISEIYECYRNVKDRPCSLGMQKKEEVERGYVLKNELAKALAEKMKSMEEEKMQAPLLPVLDKKVCLLWNDGLLGISLAGNKENNLPQVTKVSEENKLRVEVEPGNFLVQIGDYDTASGSFPQAIDYLQKVPRPVKLQFCPNNVQDLLGKLGPNDYQVVYERKHALDFTMRAHKKGYPVVGELIRTIPEHAKNKLAIDNMSVGDRILAINRTGNLTLFDALKELRQSRKPLCIRFQKTTSTAKQYTNAVKKKLNAGGAKPNKNRLSSFFSSKSKTKQVPATTPNLAEKMVPLQKDEIEVVWQKNTPLGLSLKPCKNSKAPIVGRITGKNNCAAINQIRKGDILVAINSIPVHLYPVFKDTLDEIARTTKPATLRFKRVSPTNIVTCRFNEEYEYEWKKGTSVGLVFAPHPTSRVPIVSKADTKADPACEIQVGDILLQIGSKPLTGLRFSESVRILKSVQFPVLLRFRIENTD